MTSLGAYDIELQSYPWLVAACPGPGGTWKRLCGESTAAAINNRPGAAQQNAPLGVSLLSGFLLSSAAKESKAVHNFDEKVLGGQQGGASGVYQVNADLDMAPMLKLGPFSKRSHWGQQPPTWGLWTFESF